MELHDLGLPWSLPIVFRVTDVTVVVLLLLVQVVGLGALGALVVVWSPKCRAKAAAADACTSAGSTAFNCKMQQREPGSQGALRPFWSASQFVTLLPVC